MKPIRGRWMAGPHDGRRGEASAYRAGNLVSRADDGQTLIGTAADFVSEEGDSGDVLLGKLVLAPRVSAVFEGCVRECLLNAHFCSLYGRQETRDFEGESLYIINDGSGAVGALRFQSGDVMGAISSYEHFRNFGVDALIGEVPERQRGVLTDLCHLPLVSAPTKLTAIFWTESSLAYGGEPWHQTYKYGGEVLVRELMSTEERRNEAVTEEEVPPHVFELVVGIVQRISGMRLPSLDAVELETLVPSTSPFAREGLETVAAFPRRTVQLGP